MRLPRQPGVPEFLDLVCHDSQDWSATTASYSIVHHGEDEVKVMPKGKAGHKKFRDMSREIAELRATVESQAVWPRERSRPLVVRRWDWNCSCHYYVYGDKEQCLKCGNPRSYGSDCVGVRFRTVVSGRELLPAPRAGAVANVPPAANGTTRAHIQGQSSRGADLQQKQQLQQTSVRQQRAPTPPTYRVQQPPRGQHVAQPRVVQAQQGAPAGTGGQQEKTFAGILPVGNVTQVRRDDAAKGAESAARHDISSQDEEIQQGDAPELQDDDPEATVEEMADAVTDPNRVFSRMSSVRKAIVRRSKRVDRSKEEVVEQQQILDAARVEFESRLAALAQAEADLQSFKDTHAELSRRHAELTAAAARQLRDEQRQQSDLGAAGRTQQVLWDMASSLRGLGSDPRIEQAIGMLHSLFNEAGAAATAVAGHAPPSVPVVVPTPVPVPAAPAAPAAAVHAVVVTLPAPAPAAQAICTRCWPVSCRCPPSAGNCGHGICDHD